MSEQADRDALAEVLAGTVSQLSYSVCESELNPGAIQTFRAQFAVPRGWQAKALADAVLASDWLAQRDRRVAAEALREAAEDGVDRRNQSRLRAAERVRQMDALDRQIIEEQFRRAGVLGGES